VFLVPEVLIKAIAERNRFRPKDYTLMLATAACESSRAIRELIIAVRDGRRARIRIPESSSLRERWRYISEIDAAFEVLSRRAQARWA